MLLALATFCLVATATPGPNNMMLMSSGVTFGLRRTVPHIIGISAGCAVMVLVVGWSLGSMTQYLPALHLPLLLLSSAYMLWLAWRIATAVGPGEAAARGRPFTVIEAAAFQWVNPKAWAMILSAVTNFARPGSMIQDVPVIAAVMVAIGTPGITLWAGSGSALRTILNRPAALRTFNVVMAALLVLSILPGLWDAAATQFGTQAEAVG